MQLVKALWSYRDFIRGMVKREFQGRYQRSLMGSLWAIIDPLSMIIIYSLIFSNLMGAKLAGNLDDPWAFTIHICAGVIAWEYFSEVITRTQNMFIGNANLLKKMSFPRATLPVIALSTASINFAIIFTLYLIFLLLIGRFPDITVLAWIPLLIIQQGIAVGLGLFIGTLNVFFRDIGQITQVILRFWFWFTPIVYPASILPEPLKEIMFTINPMAVFVNNYQNIMLYHTLPEFSAFIPYLLLMFVLLGIGFATFMHLSGEMVDEL
jgi:lipopolysaccharide transport system permease protein